MGDAVEFEHAAQYVSSKSLRLDDSAKLQLYGLYSQVRGDWDHGGIGFW